MSLFKFYRSKEWAAFRKVIINERTKPDGYIYDEVTGRPILKPYDIILHHKIELTEENYTDYDISLNPKHIMVVSHRTHNKLHNKLSYSGRQVYIVHGAPLSGKTRYVENCMSIGDLVIDMDNIWQCISGCERYVKPNKLKSVAFNVRDHLYDTVKYRRGKWSNAYIIQALPVKNDRERLADELGARLIHIDANKKTCLQRLYDSCDGRKVEDWEQYIEDYFQQYELYGK